MSYGWKRCTNNFVRKDSQALQKYKGKTRRRYLTHIQDEPFTYKYNDKRKVDFNPLFTAKSVVHKEVSQDIKDKYNELLQNANAYKKRKIIEQAKEDGIDITDNGGFIAEALRQCVNSTIQRQCCRYEQACYDINWTKSRIKRFRF